MLQKTRGRFIGHPELIARDVRMGEGCVGRERMLPAKNTRDWRYQNDVRGCWIPEADFGIAKLATQLAPPIVSGIWEIATLTRC